MIQISHHFRQDGRAFYTNSGDILMSKVWIMLDRPQTRQLPIPCLIICKLKFAYEDICVTLHMIQQAAALVEVLGRCSGTMSCDLHSIATTGILAVTMSLNLGNQQQFIGQFGHL